jgi:hypothetical protein
MNLFGSVFGYLVKEAPSAVASHLMGMLEQMALVCCVICKFQLFVKLFCVVVRLGTGDCRVDVLIFWGKFLDRNKAGRSWHRTASCYTPSLTYSAPSVPPPANPPPPPPPPPLLLPPDPSSRICSWHRSWRRRA